MNSKEIAKIANVSRSTVSRVINGYKNVPEETRAKVQAVIDEYGYIPNPSGRMLAGKSNNCIGLFIGDISETNSIDDQVGIKAPYNASILANVISACKERGYSVLVNTVTKEEECSLLQQYFENRMIDGGIFIGFPYQMERLSTIAKKEVNNVVLIDQLTFTESNNTKIINCDNVTCGYQATKYLIELGHKDIVFIDGDNRLSAIQRKHGYVQAMDEYQCGDSKTILYGAYREDISYHATKELLKTRIPSAIFAANYIMALGAIRAIEEKGLRIPEDISILGVDKVLMTKWQDYLTTMTFSIEDLSNKAVDLLFDKEDESRLIQPILEEKQSCKRKI